MRALQRVGKRLGTASALTVLTVALIVPAKPARAEPVPPPVPPKPKVEWSAKWPRFRIWEYAATVVFDAGSLYLYRYGQIPTQEKWQGDNFVDNFFRGWLRAGSTEDRTEAAQVSDVLANGRYVVPFLIDLPVILLAHRQLAVTWQLFMIDLEAFGVSGFINNALFYEIGRGRPDAASCAADPSYDPLCNIGQNASFPSGHTMGLATAAGLTCVHHHYLPIYGHPVADGGICALMSLATVVTATTRIMADRHHASDVIFGGVVGFGIGYGLPWALHYRAPSGSNDTKEAPRSVAVVPFAGPRELGLGLVGLL
jgi:membrane-associated phospholipid phosphatase